MKVCMLASSFPRSRKDSSAVFLYQLASWLVKKNVEIVVVAPHDNGCAFWEDMSGVKVYRFPYFFPFKYQSLAYGSGILKNLQKNPFLLFQVPLLILAQLVASVIIMKKEKVDVIHAHWSVPQGFAGVVSNMIMGIPCMLSVHGSDVFGLDNRILRSLNAFIIRKANLVTANSRATAEKTFQISSRYPDALIPMGVDTGVFIQKDVKRAKAELRIDGRVVLFVGRLIELKGVGCLIKAMPDVLDFFPDTTLVIAGDGVERRRLELLSQNLGISGNVVFIGNIPNQELVAYYNISDVFVAPSIITERGETEGLGVVLLEAMACRVPVIGSRVGGIPDIIHHNESGLLVSPGSEHQLSQSILNIFNDAALKRRIENNGQRYVRDHYSWDVVSDQFVVQYQQMMV